MGLVRSDTSPRKRDRARKIFYIGFHETGTTSIGEALRLLGYSVTGPNGVKDPRIAKNVLAMADNLVGRFDAFKDNPWPVLYRGLDARYPGSKFILTVRPTDLWIRSQVHHFGTRETPMRTWIYGKGCPEGNEGRYIERYESHNRDVIAHFAGRSDDLLVMDLAQRDPWERLCPFLGVEKPDFAFPHSNRSADRSKETQSLARFVRSAVGRLVG